jgi:hypothetical protein
MFSIVSYVYTSLQNICEVSLIAFMSGGKNGKVGYDTKHAGVAQMVRA